MDKFDVDVLSKEQLSNNFFNLYEYCFRHKKFNGEWSHEVYREVLDRKNACGVLLYDPFKDNVVLIEQFRIGAIEDENPWQFEIIAGINDKNELSREVVKREALEEAGIEIQDVEFICSYYPSAGGCTEMMDLFIGYIDSNNVQNGSLHGLEEEAEDIKVHVISREKALRMINQGKIRTASAIMTLQHLELNLSHIQTYKNYYLDKYRNNK